MKSDTRTGELYEQHAYSHDHLNAAQLKPASHEGLHAFIRGVS
jgi:hypothetical protein